MCDARKGVGLRLLCGAYLHEICYLPAALAPPCPPDYLVVHETLSHYPASEMKRKLITEPSGSGLHIIHATYNVGKLRLNSWFILLQTKKKIRAIEITWSRNYWQKKNSSWKRNKKISNYHESLKIIVGRGSRKNCPISKASALNNEAINLLQSIDPHDDGAGHNSVKISYVNCHSFVNSYLHHK